MASVPPPGTSPGVVAVEPVTDYSSFLRALDAASFAVREGGAPGLPLSLLDARGRKVVIDGEAVSTFEYPTARAFRDDRSEIRPRGDEIPTADDGTAIINWTDAPQYFGRGTLLVVYLGEDSRTLRVLNRLFGGSFAGGFY